MSFILFLFGVMRYPPIEAIWYFLYTWDLFGLLIIVLETGLLGLEIGSSCVKTRRMLSYCTEYA